MLSTLKDYFEQFHPKRSQEDPHICQNGDTHGTSHQKPEPTMEFKGRFRGLKLTSGLDYVSQLFWLVAEGALLPENEDTKIDVSSLTTTATNGRNKQKWRESTGRPCQGESDPLDTKDGDPCECPMGSWHVKETYQAIKDLDSFLETIIPLSNDDPSDHLVQMIKALKRWNGLARVSLPYLRRHVVEQDTGMTPPNQDGEIEAALRSYLTIFIRAIRDTLKMVCWVYDNDPKTMKEPTTLVAEYKLITPKYCIEDKTLYKHDPPLPAVAERVHANVLDPIFAAYPMFYIAWTWASIVFSEENGVDVGARCFAGVAETIAMYDWQDSSMSENEAAAEHEKNSKYENRLILSRKMLAHMSAELFQRRENLNDYAGAVRGLCVTAYIETKSKIEAAFESDRGKMMTAIEEMEEKNNPERPRRPAPFSAYRLLCLFDVGIADMVCEDSVNSIERSAEATSFLCIWNDIIDYKRDAACEEGRNFLSLAVAASSIVTGMQLEVAKMVAATVAGGEFMLVNGAVYGRALSSAIHLDYGWQLCIGRYGVVKTYITNLAQFVMDSGTEPPIRLRRQFLKRLSKLFDENYRATFEDGETVRLDQMSQSELVEACAIYFDKSGKCLEELLNDFEEGGWDVSAILVVRRETPCDLLRRAGVTHKFCRDRLEHAADGIVAGKTEEGKKMWSPTLIALRSSLAYLSEEGMDHLHSVCAGMHLRGSIMCDAFAQLALGGNPACDECSATFGGWVDRTSCELAAEMEQEVGHLAYHRRVVAVRAVLGCLSFSISYMAVPMLDLHCRVNVVALAAAGNIKSNAGDKIVI